MKYTIEGFNQEEAVNMKLDIKDCLILRWFIDFYDSMKSIEHNGEVYKWVKYQAIIDDLPIMYITNKEIIARHFAKLCKVQVLKRYTYKNGGTFSCYKTDVNYLKLLKRIEQTTEKSEGVRLKSRRGFDLKVGTNNKSIIEDNSIIKDTMRIASTAPKGACASNLTTVSLADEIVSSAITASSDNISHHEQFTELENQKFKEFMEDRKERKKPMTSRAKAMMIKKLINFKNRGLDICAIIDKSILKGYTDVFEIIDYTQKQQTSQNNNHSVNNDNFITFCKD